MRKTHDQMDGFKDELSGRPTGAADERSCGWPGCDGAGLHRAPKARDRLEEFHWFCLDHVREYNQSWNYFEGMSDNEFTAMVRSSATWERPTWPLGNTAGNPTGTSDGSGEDAWVYWAARDSVNSFRGQPNPGNHRVRAPGEQAQMSRLGREEQQALDMLNLDATATLQDVKKRYKQLVKRYHPDANGGADHHDRRR